MQRRSSATFSSFLLSFLLLSVSPRPVSSARPVFVDSSCSLAEGGRTYFFKEGSILRLPPSSTPLSLLVSSPPSSTATLLLLDADEGTDCTAGVSVVSSPPFSPTSFGIESPSQRATESPPPLSSPPPPVGKQRLLRVITSSPWSVTIGDESVTIDQLSTEPISLYLLRGEYWDRRPYRVFAFFGTTFLSSLFLSFWFRLDRCRSLACFAGASFSGAACDKVYYLTTACLSLPDGTSSSHVGEIALSVGVYILCAEGIPLLFSLLLLPRCRWRWSPLLSLLVACGTFFLGSGYYLGTAFLLLASLLCPLLWSSPPLR